MILALHSTHNTITMKWSMILSILPFVVLTMLLQPTNMRVFSNSWNSPFSTFTHDLHSTCLPFSNVNRSYCFVIIIVWLSAFRLFDTLILFFIARLSDTCSFSHLPFIHTWATLYSDCSIGESISHEYIAVHHNDSIHRMRTCNLLVLILLLVALRICYIGFSQKLVPPFHVISSTVKLRSWLFRWMIHCQMIVALVPIQMPLCHLPCTQKKNSISSQLWVGQIQRHMALLFLRRMRPLVLEMCTDPLHLSSC